MTNTAFERALIDYTYAHGEREELAALRKMLKTSKCFKEAKTVCLAEVNSLYSDLSIYKGAIDLCVKYAKVFDEWLFIVINSFRNSPTWDKAIKMAEKTAKTAYDLERVARLNSQRKEKT